MPRTFFQACVLCAQNYATGALLERHIREEHRPGNFGTKAGHGDSGDAPTSQPRAIRQNTRSADDQNDGERAA